jgi:Fe(3+) dicitrate transport protein
VGGVINYITRDPPRKLGILADVRYGAFDYLVTQAGIGNTHGPIGWRVDVLHRRFDGPRHLGLALTDVMGKLRLQITPTSILGVKLNFYDESSRATYLGLTQPQFDTDPSLSLASHDRFLVRRYALGLTHQQFFSDTVLLQTTAYAYQTARDWRRQEYDRSDLGEDYERICDGSGRCGPRGDSAIVPANDGGSIFFRRSAANRNRAYSVAGIEPRVTWNWTSAHRPVSGELMGLVRFHYERANDQIFISSFPTATLGDPRDAEIRNGYALALALQHRFTLWDRLRITPGIRSENFWSDRNVVREPVQLPSGGVTGQDVDTHGRAFSYAVIPGLGLAYDPVPPLTLYGGVHRGYAPPRSKDAVSASGQNLQLDPELSWNTELGARVRVGRWLQADTAGFFIDFENQIIPPTESGGAVSAGMFNTGHSRHAGLETSVTFDLPVLLGSSSFGLPLTVNYTYLPLAAFAGGLRDGNRLPYAPEHLLWAQLRFVHRLGFALQLSATYVSNQFADKENTISPSRDGLVGQLPDYFILDGRVAYTYSKPGLTFYIAGKNLTDQKYISSRAPGGIQPAGFRQVFGGVEWVWQ